jgi:uncharacterized protein YqgC (DUF456 family)
VIGLLLLILLLLAIGSLVYLQNNRLLVARCFGLLIILGVMLFVYLSGMAPLRPIHMGLLFLLAAVGIASDYYSASLRTWYFRVSDTSLWGIVIGSFIGLMMWSFINTLSGFLIGSLLGALIGEIKARGFRSLRQVLKATLGACAGLFGMSLKLILGLEMVYWLLPDIAR